MWWQIIAFVASLALSYLLRPKTETKPPPIQEFDIPTADEGREIPVLFGTRDINGPNVVWWGDTKTRPHKVSNGKK